MPGMKRPRGDDVSLALSLSLGGGGVERKAKLARRGEAGGGEFVCKTCCRAFASFQALGGHRTSHLRGRHGLALGLRVDASPIKKPAPASHHQCQVCGLGFEMGQALGGHMRRHREEAAAATAPPVLLELFV